MPLGYSTVRVNVGALIIDGVDEDDQFDDVPVTGNMVLTPMLDPAKPVQVDDGGTLKIKAIAPFEVEIGLTGQISHRNRDYVTVPAPTSLTSNLSMLQWRASFNGLKYGSKAVTVPPIYFWAEPGLQINLAEHINVGPNSTALQLSRGPRGFGIGEVEADGAELVFLSEADGAPEIGRVTVPPQEAVVGADSITNVQLAPGAVGGPELSQDAVTSSKIANDAVARAKLAEAVRTELDGKLSQTVGDARYAPVDAVPEVYQQYVAQNAPAGGPVAVSDFVNSWWCAKRSMFSSLRQCVYQAGVDAQGTMFITQFDLRRRTAEKFRLGTFEVDDHNVPAFLLEEDKPPIVAYARHAVENFVRVRIGTARMDLATIPGAAEQQVAFANATTYVHLLRRPGTDTIALLTRQADGWWFRVSNDWGTTWGTARRLHGNSYCTFNTFDGVAHYAMTTHPISDPNNGIRKMQISLATGVITNEAGTVLDNLWNFSGTVIPSASMTYVRQSYDTDAGHNTNRVFDVLPDGSVLAMRLLKSAPELGGQYGVYRRATTGATPSSAQSPDDPQRGWAWEPIVASGVPVGYYQSSYVGGMTAGANSDEVYLAREASGTWSMERWTKTGGTWSLAETLRTHTDGTKLGRPQVPWGAYGTGLVLILDYFRYPETNFGGYYGDQVVLETATRSTVPGVDTTPPSTPTGMAAASTADGAVLTWNASTGTPQAYDIYNGVTRIATVTGLTYTITGLNAGQSQPGWNVRAIDKSGNQSGVGAFPTFTPTAAPTQDPILTTGSLLLVDPTNEFGAWSAGVPANGATVPNLVPGKAALVVADNLTGADGVIERTTKGGLHAIISQVAAVQGRSYRLLAEEVRAILAANPTKSYYMSMWATVTRLSTESPPTAPSRFTGFVTSGHSDVQGARLVTNNKLSIAPSANRLGVAESATPVPVDAPQRVAAAHSTISTVGTDATAVLMGNYANSSAGKNASWILYRYYLEDLTASGRTFATVEAIDQSLYSAAFGSGGRYNGDTHTAVSTLP